MHKVLGLALAGAAWSASVPADAVSMANLNFSSTMSGTYDGYGTRAFPFQSINMIATMTSQVDMDLLRAGQTVSLAPASLSFGCYGYTYPTNVRFEGTCRETLSATYSAATKRLSLFSAIYNSDIGFSFDLLAFLGDPMRGTVTQTVGVSSGSGLFFIPSGSRITVNSGSGTLTASVPETATWVMMLGGFGTAGLGMRRRRTVERTSA